MRRFQFGARPFAIALLLGLTSAAGAQPPMRYTPPPAFSPYLNLNRAGASPAINYFGIVRPQIDFRNSIQGLQQDYRALATQRPTDDPFTTDLPPTGHTPQFLNYGGYFGRPLNSVPGAQAGAGAAGAARYTPPQTRTGRPAQTGPIIR